MSEVDPDTGQVKLNFGPEGLNLTAELNKHLQVPQELRDDAWSDELSRLTFDAPLKIMDPEQMVGPDGNGYFCVGLPSEGEEFAPFFLRKDLYYLLDWTMGLVLLRPDGQTHWVFSHGDILSYALFARWNQPKWLDVPVSPGKLSDEMMVMTGTPNDQMLPLVLRRSLRRYMKEALSIEEPKVGLVRFPSHRVGSLIFNLDPEKMGGEEKADIAFRRLAWVIPRNIPFIRIDSMASASFLSPV